MVLWRKLGFEWNCPVKPKSKHEKLWKLIKLTAIFMLFPKRISHCLSKLYIQQDRLQGKYINGNTPSWSTVCGQLEPFSFADMPRGKRWERDEDGSKRWGMCVCGGVSVCVCVRTFHSCPSTLLEWNSSLLWHRLMSLVQCLKRKCHECLQLLCFALLRFILCCILFSWWQQLAFS